MASPFGLSWIDPSAGFVIAYFAVRGTGEAWEGELVCETMTTTRFAWCQAEHAFGREVVGEVLDDRAEAPASWLLAAITAMSGDASGLASASRSPLHSDQPLLDGERLGMDLSCRLRVKVDVVVAQPSPHRRLVGA